jgi:hypothetical protein
MEKVCYCFILRIERSWCFIEVRPTNWDSVFCWCTHLSGNVFERLALSEWAFPGFEGPRCKQLTTMLASLLISNRMHSSLYPAIICTIRMRVKMVCGSPVLVWVPVTDKFWFQNRNWEASLVATIAFQGNYALRSVDQSILGVLWHCQRSSRVEAW